MTAALTWPSLSAGPPGSPASSQPAAGGPHPASAQPVARRPSAWRPPRAPASPRAALPAAPRRLRIGMPHLDAAGLSENWLFRAAGDLHWEAITHRLGVRTDEIVAADQARLYPMVIALRARYDVPLAAVAENDLLTWSVDVAPCGGACAHGTLVARVGAARFTVELLTSFAARQADGSMRTALPAARLAARWQTTTPEAGSPPPSPAASAAPAAISTAPSALAALARAVRRGEPVDDDFVGPALQTDAPVLGATTYEPSPYADYNGVGLLYFASYVTIAATAERQLAHRLGLVPPRARSAEWALATSPLRRELFFTGNLPLGGAVRTELLGFAPERGADEAAAGSAGPHTLKTRLALRRAADEATMAHVVTRHEILGRPAASGSGRAAGAGR